MSSLSFGLGYVFVYAVGVATLADYPLARAWMGTVAQLGAALVCVVVILRRRAEWAGCQRLFWLTIAAGIATWGLGHVGWAYDMLFRGRTEWVAWHTVFSFCGSSAPLIGLFAWPHLGPRRSAYAITAVDIAALAVLNGFLVTYFILIPQIDPASAPFAWTSLLVAAQTQRMLMFAGMVGATLVAAGQPWGPTYRRLAGAIGVGLALRLLLNAALLAGRYEPGMLFDLAWIVPILGYAWAAVEAPPSEQEEPDIVRRQPAHPWVSTGAFALAAVIGYGIHLAWPLGPTVDATRVLITTLTVLVGLALVTIRMIVQRSELQRADHRMRLLAAVSANTGDLVAVVRSGGVVEEVNHAFLAVTGFSPAEVHGTMSADLLAPDSAARLQEVRDAVARDGVWRGTLQRRKNDGATFPVACTVTGLRDQAGRITHLVGIERDISDELKMREQLIHSERMAAMSEVVAGVAHEINNPLQAILGCTELLLEGSQGQTRGDLEIVRSESMRAGQIVRSLLAFVHRGPGERHPTDLNELARSTVALRSYSLTQSNIAVDVTCHPSPLTVIVNAEEIRQVLLNLVLNAEQAIRKAGRPSGRISVSTCADERGFTLQVSDDGPGIPAQLRARVFEPFFTTKEVGEGTGLGLSISLGIGLAHGGTLEHVPAPGGGAIFRLTLPKAAAAFADAGPSAAKSPEPPLALIVEDDGAIRGLLERLLVRRGYRVLPAVDGAQALAEMRDAVPDLIICEVRMPRMNGPDFYRQAVRQHAAVARRFVLLTGDTARADAEQFAASAHVPLLPKPFTATDLDVALLELKQQSAV